MSPSANGLDVAAGIVQRLREMRRAADRAESYVVGYRQAPDDVALLYLARGEGARLLFEGTAAMEELEDLIDAHEGAGS